MQIQTCHRKIKSLENFKKCRFKLYIEILIESEFLNGSMFEVQCLNLACKQLISLLDPSSLYIASSDCNLLELRNILLCHLFTVSMDLSLLPDLSRSGCFLSKMVTFIVGCRKLRTPLNTVT
jgi:hypothetical protein